MLQVFWTSAKEPTTAKDQISVDYIMKYWSTLSDEEQAREFVTVWNHRAKTLTLLEQSQEYTKAYKKLLDKEKKQYAPTFGIAASFGGFVNTELWYGTHAGVDLYLFYYKYFFWSLGADYVFYPYSGVNVDFSFGFKFAH